MEEGAFLSEARWTVTLITCTGSTVPVHTYIHAHRVHGVWAGRQETPTFSVVQLFSRTISPSLSYSFVFFWRSHWMEVSKRHTWWGEAFGFVCWMWIFHRARLDGPVVLGWRHPWEHAPGDDDHALPHVHDEDQLQAEWDTFLAKAIKPGEDDDDDDDDEEEDDDDDDDDE